MGTNNHNKFLSRAISNIFWTKYLKKVICSDLDAESRWRGLRANITSVRESNSSEAVCKTCPSGVEGWGLNCTKYLKQNGILKNFSQRTQIKKVGSILFCCTSAFFTPPVTYYMLLYSTLLCKK